MSSEESEVDKNDSVFDISLFVDEEIAKAFACVNCNNIPRQCINDIDGKIYCEFCVAQLKIINTKANSAMDKIVDGLKMKVENINKSHDENQDEEDQDEINGGSNNDNNDNNDVNEDEKEEIESSWSGTVGEWRKRIEIEKEKEKEKEREKEKEKEKETEKENEKKKNLEKHAMNEENECIEEPVDKSLKEQITNLELKMNLINKSLKEEISNLEKKVITQNKTIEHLKYRNCKLQMQIHNKQTLKDDFLIIFESDNDKNSFISSLNFKYNSSISNHNLIKALTPRNNKDNDKRNVIYKRVKDCSYALATNVSIDRIIGITSKSRTQHIMASVPIMSNQTVCKFDIIYRIGGDTLNVNENNNICNILGTDVVFQLPQLQISRFNHRCIYSSIHGILSVGGEPIKKEDAKKELKQIDKENESNKKKSKDKDKDKNRKAILNSVEQLNLAPNIALSHYYQVRNANIKKDEEKLQMPPEPELKWRNLGSSMKYRRDCPSVGLFKSGNKSEEQLFVAGGWNEKDLNYVEMYNFKKREWKQLSSLNVKRNSAGICEWKQKNNNMIIIGGWNKKTTNSVEEYDSHKNQWYALKNTNYPHKYYPACTVYHDLNPFINTGYGVIVVLGNDGRLYGDEYIKKQQVLMQKKNKEQVPKLQQQNSPSNRPSTKGKDEQPSIKDDWGFIEFYDPRDWIRKWQVIDNLPSFLGFDDNQCKSLYFQTAIPCQHNAPCFNSKH